MARICLASQDCKLPEPPAILAPRASDYFGRFYVDIHSMDTPAIECAIKTVGPERIVFGSDFPYNPPQVGIRFAKQRLAALDAPASVKERIARENGRVLLGL